MSVWLDHLTSILMAGVVILILAAIWYRNQVSAAATTNTYRDRARIEVIRETIDRDMARLGADVDPADAAILGWSWTGTTRTFEFRGAVHEAGRVDRIRYLATRTACTTSDASTCWRLQRQTWTGSDYAVSGFDMEVATVQVSLTPTGPVADATGVSIRIVLPAPELRPNTTATDPRRLPISLDRYYRLVNQVLRASA